MAVNNMASGGNNVWQSMNDVPQVAWSLLVLHFFSGYTKVYPQKNPALIGSGLI